MPIWKLSAVSDRRGIAKYIALDNPTAAVEIVDLIINTAGMLDANPKIGRAGRMKGTRETVAHPRYVLVYQVSAGTVTILRVLHTSQAWPA
jgi:addiction module RelE/StbE family toxin